METNTAVAPSSGRLVCPTQIASVRTVGSVARGLLGWLAKPCRVLRSCQSVNNRLFRSTRAGVQYKHHHIHSVCHIIILSRKNGVVEGRAGGSSRGNEDEAAAASSSSSSSTLV